MMKFLSNKEMNKITKSTLALVLAGTFTFSTTNAFANESDAKTNEEAYQTIELPNNVTKDTKVNNLNEDASKENNEELNKTAAPSLVPGNFFYFAKITIEKIKLAFTFNQEKEAKILAEYAAERLSEADVLFKNGKEQEATELIEKAIENMSNVDKGEVDVVVDDKEDSLNEVNELLSQNIIALKAALEKIKNPVAKAALQKNIEKSYAKLAKKIAKIDKKYELEKEEQTITIDQKITKEISSIGVEDKANKEENKNEKTAVVPVSPVKEVKHELKNDKKAAQAQEKLARELAKKEEKAKREEAKQQWKELKDKEKQERKEFKQNLKLKDHEHKQKNHEEKGNRGEHKGNN